MKAVILCGGQGTRLREETEFKPKPMVEVGGVPILWHIMKIYSGFGIKDFVLCLGYKSAMIKEYFLHRELMSHDVTVNLKDGKRIKEARNSDMEDWNITLADTGLNAMTGARVKKIERYIDEDEFFLTYGDGVADINIDELAGLHRKNRTTGTLTGVNPVSRFGMIKSNEGGVVTEFVEKPRLFDEYVNGGYYMFDRKFFDFLEPDDSCILERRPLSTLAEKGQLSLYKHRGFWHCMDTYRDYLDLNAMWDTGKAPWKAW